ncbi:Uncharacterised protein [Serratia proteamaculans]|nr:Uncharacterised protein [Serratia proteamaculans]
MKINQYIHILLVAGSALVASLILIASGSWGFLFLSLSIHRHPWHGFVE